MCSTPSAAARPRTSASQLYHDDALVAEGVTDDDGRIGELGAGPAGHLSPRLPPALAVLPPRRAGASRSARATTTSRCSISSYACASYRGS